MGVYTRIRGWLDVMLAARAQEHFGIKTRVSGELDGLLSRCADIYRGCPDWLDRDKENGIETVNFAKSICSETARLATLAIGIKISGSPRAEWLQKKIDEAYQSLRHWVEYGCAYGTVIMKPNGENIDLLTPGSFAITDTRGSMVTGAIFQSREYDQAERKYYTRLEHHRFLDDGRYAISNRCFVGDSPMDAGKPVPIEATPWADLAEEIIAEGVEKPLFGVLRMPAANNIDTASPMGLPVFADAIKELRDLDVAYSRNAAEIFDSNRIALVDDRLTEQSGSPVGGVAQRVKLPRFVRKAFGIGQTEYYEEINPQLNTEQRLTGINALLSQIGFKCGFSNGYFVFNERSGVVTATQVEADDRRTIQLVKDVRDKLEAALDGVIYALDKFADAYDLAPVGEYEVVYDFGDITYNREEDRARWWGYVIQNQCPAWYYMVKFEGLSEKEAKALVNEAKHREYIPPAPEE